MEGATSTLADALLDDLDDLDDFDDNGDEQGQQQAGDKDDDALGDDDNDDDDDMKPAAKDENGNNHQAGIDWWPRHTPRLLDDPKLQKHVETVRSLLYNTNSENDNNNNNEENRNEYNHKLLVKSNQYLIASTKDVDIAHIALCQAYEARFPELEELVPDPTQYVQAVRIIGNNCDQLTEKSINDQLNIFLSNHQIITLSVAASTTAGRSLTDVELQRVNEIVTYMEQIMDIQNIITLYIEQQMEDLAPSMCALIGPSTAAKLLALTGSLENLSKIPSCNLQVLGQIKQNGKSSASSGLVSGGRKQQPHQGILINTPLVQQCTKHMQTKALKMVAAKLALAIRYDYINVQNGRPRSAAAGNKFKHEIETKFIKLQEPDKAPVLKALPKPDLTVKKRRGGKRMRRLKERYEETEMMKQANTRVFSQATGEYGDDAMGKTLGLLDTAEITAVGTSLRKNTAEKRKMKFANTRASRKKATQMARTAASKNTSGLASSMVFTPVQGMELINPDANKDRVRDANRKWFAENAGFQSALPKK